MRFDTGYILNQRYRIVSLLGQGGMGAVYRAWDINLGIPVAIKENLDASPEARKQFIREAQMLARLSHPNLPRVTDHFFIQDQGQYLVMDFVEGEDLHVMLKRMGSIPEGDAVAWVGQVCDALSYLHSQSPPIIHRDIKPANIKIRPDGTAMLVDFGIAKVHDPHLKTTVGARAVTPGYSPPEQYGTSTTDARSDIYALGATLYHLLTGHLPPESIHRVSDTDRMPAVRSFKPSVTQPVDQAVKKATQVTSESRYQTVEDFKKALTQRQTYDPTQYVAPISPPVQSAAHQQVVPVSTPRSQPGGIPGWIYAVVGVVVVACVALVAVVVFGGGLLDISPPSKRTSTPTPSPTATVVPTGALTATATNIPTITNTATATIIPTFTSTPTATSPPTPTPTPSGFYIPSINSWVTEFNFYEGDLNTTPEKEDRVYRTRFHKDDTRTIYWELNLTHPQRDSFLDFVFRSVIYNPDGSERGNFETDTYLEPDWIDSWHTTGWGWEQPGNWPIGNYKVELYIEDQLIVEDFFEIYQ